MALSKCLKMITVKCEFEEMSANVYVEKNCNNQIQYQQAPVRLCEANSLQKGNFYAATLATCRSGKSCSVEVTFLEAVGLT